MRRRQWHPTPVLLLGKSHGRRSLVGCSPWGLEESDTTERLHFHFSLSCTGEGNGKPLQCSCLENPRDRGAWWATIYGVAQSRTRLKWLRTAYILLMYSCLTNIQVQSKVTQLYIYTYIIFQFIFHYRYFKRLTKGLQFLGLYSKTLLVVAHLFLKLEV